MDNQTGRQTSTIPRPPQWWRIASVVVVALVLGVLMQATLLWAAPPAAPATAGLAQETPNHDGHEDGKHDEWVVRTGVVVTRPEVVTGTWVISRGEPVSYAVSGETEIEGDIGVGECVEVKSAASDPTVALKIRVKDAHHCNKPDDHDHDDDDLIKFSGVIMTKPVELFGEWVIGGKAYNVTGGTELEGALEEAVCVEVRVRKSDPITAVKIEAQAAHKCERGGDDEDDDHGQRLHHYGVIESRPEGKVGLWVIGGETFSATEQTELDFDHGRLMVGVCAKVTSLSSAPQIAREIESENDYKCRARDDDNFARGKLYGLVEELPDDITNGVWAIGGMRFVVSPTTELITKGGTFTIGTLVKVDFRTDVSDTNYARRIEIKYPHACRRLYNAAHDASVDHGGPGGDDHHPGKHHPRYGFCPGGEGKSIGIIDSRPTDTLLGEWVIGGVPYLTDATTQFAHDDDFLVGERVKVEFVVLDNNTRLATKVKETGKDGGISNPKHSLIVGFVDAKPDGFSGEWVINGETFSVTETSRLFELGSLFVVGAYVVVEYDIDVANDARIVIQMVTYVPPGAGDEDTTGTLEAVGGAVSAQVAAAGVDAFAQGNEVWTVDGVDFIVSEATQLVDSGGELVPGATVFVNSYTENGQRYATLVRTQSGELHIPFAAR